MNAAQPSPQPRTLDAAPAIPSTKEQVLGPEEAAVLEGVLSVRQANPNAKPTSAQDLLAQFGLN